MATATTSAPAGRPVPQDYAVQASEFEVYEEGVYPAQVVDVELVPNKFKPGTDQFRWKCELPTIEREDGEPAYLSYFTSPTLSGKSKFGMMVLAARRPIPLAGEPGIKPLSLIGEWFSARVINTMRDDGSVGCKIDELLPITPKQRRQITLTMPGTEPADEEDETPAAKSNAAAAANTAGEEATAAAVAELRPTLMMLLDSLKAKKQKLSAENAGPGLLQLGKSANTQNCKLPDLDFSLISLSTIKAAMAEAHALIKTLTDDEGGEVDPFEAGDVFKEE